MNCNVGFHRRCVAPNGILVVPFTEVVASGLGCWFVAPPNDEPRGPSHV
jgi:hypothetical protein